VDPEALTTFVARTEARLVVLENAVRHAWINLLQNTDGSVLKAFELENNMVAMAMTAVGDDIDSFGLNVLDATQTFWRDVREGVQSAT
jgi:hypothetical protein